MTPPAPWSPTAHAFAQHQFSHVVNFWKQGRQASLRLEALPGGRAELNVTFQLPPPSEVIPPPSYPGPTQQRPIHPLFPGGFSPQGHASGLKQKPAAEKKLSSKQRKSYRRAVLHRAALAAPSLPPPKDGSLRHAALACVRRLQAASASPVSTPSSNKRPFPDSPNTPSPSNPPPLAQRIRSDFQISEGEVESPERESLRSRFDPDSFPPLNSPHSVQKVPPPAPLFFTPPKPHEGSEMPAKVAEEVSVEKVAAFEGSEEVSAFEDSVVVYDEVVKEDEVVGKSDEVKEDEVKEDEVVGKSESCWNCDAQMTPGHQCELESDKIEVEDEERRRTERVKVLYDYEAEQAQKFSKIRAIATSYGSTFLTIKKGDLIDLVKEDESWCPGWWTGKVGGKEGLFPANFVEKV